MAGIEAVIFDMDGLIIDSEPLWREAEIATFAGVGVTITEADCNFTMGWRTNEVIEYWSKERPWSGATVAEVELDLLNRVEQLILERGEAMPGLYALLNQLTEQQIPLALASSSPMQLIQAVVKKLDLADYFKIIRSAETEEFGKPHPAVFIHTAADLAIDPVRCLVLEDSLNGVIAGKAAKMRVVAVPAAEEFSRAGFAVADGKLESLMHFPKDLLN